MAAEPYAILRIKDRTGKVVYEHKPKTTQAFKDKEAGVLTAAMQGVVDHGTGTAAQFGRPLAGKTGTSENYGNAWFVGFVPQLSTAVWVGRPEGDVPLRNIHGINVTGGTYPARIFSRYMKAALADVPVQPLFTASPDDLGLKSTVVSAPPAPSTTVESTTTTTTQPFNPFPTTSLPPATIPRQTTTTVARPSTTTPRPTTTTTVVPPTTTTTVKGP